MENAIRKFSEESAERAAGTENDMQNLAGKTIFIVMALINMSIGQPGTCGRSIRVGGGH
jgi:hypothetical protein